jgi:Uri superfamily endonuclease
MVAKEKSPGTYILILRLKRDRFIRIGKLGKFHFAPGYYTYTGSAFGPGGLNARLKHHLKLTPRPHWHIDYLKNAAKVIEVWYSKQIEHLEHRCAEVFREISGVMLPAKGFGSTDCKCEAHLFYFVKRPFLHLFREAFQNHYPASDGIQMNRRTL